MTIRQLLQITATHLQRKAVATGAGLHRARHRLRRQVEAQLDELLFTLYLRGVITIAAAPVPVVARRRL